MKKVIRDSVFELVTQSLLFETLWTLFETLCDSVGYSPPGSSVHGTLQARILLLLLLSRFSRVRLCATP